MRLHYWYQDDGFLLVSRAVAGAAIELLKTRGPEYGFHLNMQKTALFSPTTDLNIDPLPELPSSLLRLRLEEGVEFLGGMVSFSEASYAEFFQQKLNHVRVAWNRLASLDDPQVALTLFRMCGGLVQFQHLFATIDPTVLQTALVQLDRDIVSVLQSIIGHPISPELFDLISLPIRHGGIGTLSACRLAPVIYGCAKIATLDFVDTLLPANMSHRYISSVEAQYHAFLHDFFQRCPVPECHTLAEFRAEVDAHGLARRQYLSDCLHTSAVSSIRRRLTGRSLANFNASFADYASDWLTALPSMDVSFDPQVFRIAMHRRYGLQLHDNLESRFCPMCSKKILDPYGDHALVCRNGSERTKRHNELVQVLYRAIKTVVPAASLEEKYLLINGTNQRPADIFVPSLSHGQSYAIDVTVVAHTRAVFQSKLKDTENIGCVAQSGVETKMKKFAESCAHSGLVFIPFALDAGGGYSASAKNFVHLVCSLARGKSNCPLPVLKRRLRDHFAVVIQKWHSYFISNRYNYLRPHSVFHPSFDMNPQMCSFM